MARRASLILRDETFSFTRKTITINTSCQVLRFVCNSVHNFIQQKCNYWILKKDETMIANLITGRFLFLFQSDIRYMSAIRREGCA